MINKICRCYYQQSIYDKGQSAEPPRRCDNYLQDCRLQRFHTVIVLSLDRKNIFPRSEIAISRTVLPAPYFLFINRRHRPGTCIVERFLITVNGKGQCKTVARIRKRHLTPAIKSIDRRIAVSESHGVYSDLRSDLIHKISRWVKSQYTFITTKIHYSRR